jgi:hypothetical protein
LENCIVVRKCLYHGMHLITQEVHVLPCSHSAVKGNNGTNRIPYHDIAAQTITEPLRVLLSEPGISDCRLPWVFSKRKLFLMQGKAWRTIRLTIPGARLQLSDVQVLWSWHHRLDIWILLSVIRGLATAALPWMLDLWSSRLTVFVETVKMNIQFCCHLCCSSFFIFRNYSYSSQCKTITFCQCWFSPTAPLRSCLPMIRACRHNLRNYCSLYI